MTACAQGGMAGVGELWDGTRICGWSEPVLVMITQCLVTKAIVL